MTPQKQAISGIFEANPQVWWTCGGEKAATQGELHAPDGPAMVTGEVLAKLDVLKVPGSGLVRLDAFEAGRGRFSAVLAGHLQK